MARRRPRTRNAWFVYLIPLIMGSFACAQSTSHVPERHRFVCAKPEQWNADAFTLFRKGDFRGAIYATNKSKCKWKDYELLFSSYLALYLHNPSNKVRQNALMAISEYRRTKVITGSVDPGPLYVALWDINGAKNWYMHVVAVIPRDYSGNNKRGLENMRRAALASLKVLNSRNWSLDQKMQLLEQLSRAISTSKEKNGGD